jgi:hypothetical protein
MARSTVPSSMALSRRSIAGLAETQKASNPHALASPILCDRTVEADLSIWLIAESSATQVFSWRHAVRANSTGLGLPSAPRPGSGSGGRLGLIARQRFRRASGDFSRAGSNHVCSRRRPLSYRLHRSRRLGCPLLQRIGNRGPVDEFATLCGAANGEGRGRVTDGLGRQEGQGDPTGDVREAFD